MPTSSLAVATKRSSASAAKLLIVLVLGPLLLAGVFQLRKAAEGISLRGDNTYPESAVVQTAIWAKTTGHLYPNLDRSPYTPAPYGPFFYVALSGLAKVANLGFGSLLIVGRIVAIGVYLSLLLIAYRWERRYLRPLFALFAPAILLAQVDFVDWDVTVRPDLPALGLTLAALLFISRQRSSDRTMLAAGILCGLAGAMKQSFIALPLATVLWLLWSRRFRFAVLFIASTAITGGLVLAALAVRHEPFMKEMLLARYSPLNFVSAIRLVKGDFVQNPLQMVTLGLAAVGIKWVSARDPKLRCFMALYLGTAWLVGFYTAMAPGANVNAFLEAWLVVALLAPFSINEVCEQWESVPFASRALLLVLWLSVSAVTLDRWRTIVSTPTPSLEKVAEFVKGRRVLTDLPFVAAHSVHPEMLDPSVNHYLELAGQWSAQPVLDELRRREFDYVIVAESDGEPRSWRGLTIFSTSILREIDEDYRPLCSADQFAIYVPVGAAEAAATDTVILTDAGCK